MPWIRTGKLVELENRLKRLEQENEILRKNNEELRRAMKGDHVISAFCTVYRNGVISPMTGEPFCKLECKCKDASLERR